MAYLDFRETFDTTTAAAPTSAQFDETEWRVIVLAGKEGLASLAEPGALARFVARLTGTPAVRKLASPRLEALRRFSVLAWHYSYALPVSAIAGLLNAGFNEAQLDYALASIAQFRDRAGSRRAA